MRARTPSAGAVPLAATLAVALAAGCGDPAPTDPPPSPTRSVPAGPSADRAQLAARAAAAKDRRYAALYTLRTAGRPDRTVVVTRAADGGWRVDIPGGALGGTADVSVARTPDGLFLCELPSAYRPINPTCVRMGGPEGGLAGRYDPGVQHVFVDWLAVLTDRGSAIAVATARPLNGAPGGDCFSVESNSASLAAPLDAGIYCYTPDGMLTGARVSFGTLTLSGPPAAPPPTIALPGAVVDAPPLPQASPPPPPTTAPAATGDPAPTAQ